jgi:hypothetical protein
MGLGFLSPLFLAGLAAAAIPIVLHLFRRQADPVVPFGAVRLLRRVPQEQAQRKRLRGWIQLALRTAALVLLALSFARPYLAARATAATGPLTIVAVDASYSLSAPGQMDRARELARAAIDGAQPGAVALVRFDNSADVIVPPSADRASARSAIASIAPGEGGTSYARLIARAMELAEHRNTELVVVTDLQQAGWSIGDDVPAIANLRVTVREVPAPPGNLGVADLDALDGRAVVRLRSSYAAERDATVRLTIDDRPFEERRVKIAPAATADVVFERKLPATGALLASVQDHDGYGADNRRYLVLDPVAPTQILAVTGPGGGSRDALYFQRAVAAVEGGAGLDVATVSSDRVGADDPALRNAAAVVLVGTTGLDRRAVDAIASAADAGRSVLIVAGPSVELERVTSALAPELRVSRAEDAEPAVTLAPVDVRHPVFAAFGVDGGLLGSATFRRYARIEGGSPRILAKFSSGAPALVELPRGRGRVLVFTSDLSNHWNDLVLHPAFVPLAHDLARYLVGGAVSLRSVRVGELPGPEGTKAGVVSRTTAGTAPERIAVNVDAREGDPTRMTADAFVAVIPKAQAGARPDGVTADVRRQESEQSLWRYGLALILVGLVLESVVGRQG